VGVDLARWTLEDVVKKIQCDLASEPKANDSFIFDNDFAVSFADSVVDLIRAVAQEEIGKMRNDSDG